MYGWGPVSYSPLLHKEHFFFKKEGLQNEFLGLDIGDFILFFVCFNLVLRYWYVCTAHGTGSHGSIKYS